MREFGGIIINEVYSTVPGQPGDWFELYNTGPDTIDLSGWELYVDGELFYTFPEGETLDSGDFWVSDLMSFLKARTYELYDDSDPQVLIDAVTLPTWQARSYGVIGTPEDEYADLDWMVSTPGEINIGQVAIPEFESVMIPLAIVTIMFFAIRRKRRERTTEDNREGESDDGHE